MDYLTWIRIEREFDVIKNREDLIMATVQEVAGKLDAVLGVVGAIAADVRHLKAQIGAGGAIAEKDLDPLLAKADAILSAAKSVDDMTPPAAPPDDQGP